MAHLYIYIYILYIYVYIYMCVCMCEHTLGCQHSAQVASWEARSTWAFCAVFELRQRFGRIEPTKNRQLWGGQGTSNISNLIDHWLVVWNVIFLIFHTLGIIIPTDKLIFFRGVGQPPTSFRLVTRIGKPSQNSEPPDGPISYPPNRLRTRRRLRWSSDDPRK
jgi:hypothetical protein